MTIKKLSNQELDANLKRLVAGERKILHLILEHINEVDSRKLYLEKAYSSLYEYLVQECHYSGSAAMRRISAARLMREVPEAAEQIQNGRLSLSQVSELSRAIKEKEKTGIAVSATKKSEMVAAISGKTTGETQKRISQALDLELKVPETTFVQKDDSVHLQMTLTADQYANLLQCRDRAASILLSEDGDVSLSAVIDLLAKSFLAQKNPGVVLGDLSGRSVRSDKESLKADENSGETPSDVNSKTSIAELNKTLTPKTRIQVFSRDRCCQFKDPKTGRICGSTFNLEIDHIQPRWAQGNHAIQNLQVLCRAHNNFKYHKELNLRLC